MAVVGAPEKALPAVLQDSMSGALSPMQAFGRRLRFEEPA
jgi:hypothetical protein